MPSCSLCCAEFAAKHSEQKLCSLECQRRYLAALQSAKRLGCTCAHCKIGFKAKTRRYIKYCSRECYFAAGKRRTEARMRARSASLTRACKQCGATFTTANAHATVCSETCRVMRGRSAARSAAQRSDARERSTRPCKQCRTGFAPKYGDQRRTFCSRACSLKHGRRIGKAMRRARSKGVSREGIDPLVIFERDGWRCHLCRLRTPQRLRGTLHPRAPELDHILPLALGGTHTKENLACSCRSCNGAKGSKPIGQMRLTLVA